MYNSKLKDLFYGNLGVTGLETAIILIGLVVVAAVFAFVVMTVGLFSSEKSKNISYEALTESTSSFIVKGGITATCGVGDDNLDCEKDADPVGKNDKYVDSISFAIALSSGSDIQSINKNEFAFHYFDGNNDFRTSGDVPRPGIITDIDITEIGSVTGVKIVKKPPNPAPNINQLPHKVGYAGRDTTWNKVDFNNTGLNVITVKPGEAINMNVSMEYTHSKWCPGCIVQFYVKMNDTFSNCLRSGGTHGGGSVNKNIKFTAPNKPGTYYIQFAGTLHWFCLKNNSASDKFGISTLGTVIVADNPDVPPPKPKLAETEVLESGDIAIVTIYLNTNTKKGEGMKPATDVIHLGANTTFKIEMISPKGASLILERTIPMNLTKVMNLQ